MLIPKTDPEERSVFLFFMLAFCVFLTVIIATLEADGWYLVRTKGCHCQFRHPSKPGTLTVAGKLGVDVPVGTLGSIWKQAGLKKVE